MENLGEVGHEAIERHVQEHFGPIEFVFHAVPSTGVHVLVAGPTEDRPFRTLVTEGMSDEPMTVPDGVGPFAELMMSCPTATRPCLTRRTRSSRAWSSRRC